MYLKVKIIPKSSSNKIIGWMSDLLKIKIKAEPKKGKGNKELIKFLSKILQVPKYKINIIKGVKSNVKIIDIDEDTKYINNVINNITDKH